MRLLLTVLLLLSIESCATARRKGKKKAPLTARDVPRVAASRTHLLPFEELAGIPATDSSVESLFLPELGLPLGFLGEAWDTSPLLVRLGSSAFHGMMDLSSGDLDTLIQSNTLRMGTDAHFSQNGNKGTGKLPTLTLDEARWRLDDGASIMVTALEKFWPKCIPLVEATQKALQFYASINMYVTPPEARGFDVHYDYEDVFILQVHGSKRWRVWAPDPGVDQMELPSRNNHRTLPSKSKVPTTVPFGIEMQRCA